MRYLKTKVAAALNRNLETQSSHSQGEASANYQAETVNLTHTMTINFERPSLPIRRDVNLPLIRIKNEEELQAQLPQMVPQYAPLSAPVKREFKGSPFVSPNTMVKGNFNDFNVKTSPQTTNQTSKGAYSHFSFNSSPYVSPQKAAKGVFNDFSSAKTPTSNSRKKEPQSNKNIVKNYARAMVNFALSSMARPFLIKMVKAEGISLEDFKVFVQEQKEDINSIKTLRAMLLITDEDEDVKAAFKRTFRGICEIFIKFFSINWIFNSKISDRLMHLKYRFKILRRVRNPEHFTYLENFNKTR